MNNLRRKIKKLSWYAGGKKPPVPHFMKHEMLRFYGHRFCLKIFVETGTHSGGTVAAMRKYFDRLISIELSKDFYEKAKSWLGSDQKITLIHGDSGIEMKAVVEGLDAAALFWLDGHYSAGNTAMGATETPIVDELNHIFGIGDMKHVVIVDDARLFGSNPAYPSIDAVVQIVLSYKPEYKFTTKYDALIFTPY